MKELEMLEVAIFIVFGSFFHHPRPERKERKIILILQYAGIEPQPPAKQTTALSITLAG